MTSQLCSVAQHSAPWIGAVAVLVTFASLFFYILLFLFFICLLLILSASTIFTLSKKSRIVGSDQEDSQSEEVEAEDVVKIASAMCNESVQEEQECQEEEIEVHEIFSSSDNVDDQFSTSAEDSDLDLDSPYDYSRSQELTDGSISDEESLIEIALPSGQYVSSPEFKLPPLSAEAMFKQHGLMELLAEFNEENLIEIDISMGSIMCPRFEIKA
ncbi:hypothetical protein DCAR_0522505 [Daucus carota subsp. sativus]|nr:hypothetical protein DCAR_0522505 [Daucus carota subsp. sativus]